MRWRAISISGLSLVWLLVAGGDGRAQEPGPTKHQIMAAFMFNFAKFVEWPEDALPRVSPIVIGILGKNPFGNDLARTVQDRTIDDHPLVIIEFQSAASARNCHMLFICDSEADRLSEILGALKSKDKSKGVSVLTVSSEMKRFTETGVMINFVQRDGKLRFQINKDAATEAGLKISSKLMTLAVR